MVLKNAEFHLAFLLLEGRLSEGLMPVETRARRETSMVVAAEVWGS